MKYSLITAMSVLAMGNVASAAGVARINCDCSAGSGEKVRMAYLSTSPAGGIGSVSQPMPLGLGTHSTGDVTVKVESVEGGGPTSYVNEEKKFFLTLSHVERSPSGKVIRIEASGNFAEPGGWEFTIQPKWFVCE